MSKEPPVHLRFRAVNRNTFEAIRDRRKNVETRAATEKYRDIRAGRTAVFSCGRWKFERKIRKAAHFPSIRALLRKYPPQKINPECRTEKDLRAMYASFPEYAEKIKKHGLMAFDLE